VNTTTVDVNTTTVDVNITTVQSAIKQLERRAEVEPDIHPMEIIHA
jgi:hypothetical protein